MFGSLVIGNEIAKILVNLGDAHQVQEWGSFLTFTLYRRLPCPLVSTCVSSILSINRLSSMTLNKIKLSEMQLSRNLSSLGSCFSST